MAWIEVHQSLRDHRKILALADALDMPEPHVAGHCLYLWLWSLDNAPDGVLPTSARIIARAACWTGDAEQFLDAMIQVGMIDRNGHLSIHDWDDYAGKIADRRERNKQAMRAAREREKTERVQHVSNTSEPRDATSKATVPNPTLPNSTVSNSSAFSSNGYQKSSSSKRDSAREKPTTTPLLKTLSYAEQARWVADVPDDLQLSWTVNDRRTALESMLKWCKENGKPPSEMRYHKWLKDERNHVPENATEVEQLEAILKSVNKETGICSNGQTYTNNMDKLRAARQREKTEREREYRDRVLRDSAEAELVHLEPSDSNTTH